MSRTRTPDSVRAMLDRGVFDIESFEAWLAANGWAWQLLERGEYGFSVDDAVLAWISEDPVRWAETYMIEPDTGAPYQLFDYQRESLRSWRQDVVHQDGAEVGKTREIVVLILWAMCTAVGGTRPNPWILVGAPQQTHLDEIIMAVEEQVGAGDESLGERRALSGFWARPKKTPHMMQRFISPNPHNPTRPSIGRVYYRPAGHDGEAFRGVHVNAFGLMDEAAKLKRAVQWSEFWRALKPGCRSRVYSVPDGDRATGYFKLTQGARENLPETQRGTRLFRWPKTLMPPPFWTAERDAEFAARFGSRTAPGYLRNVLGEHGQAENPVISWDVLLPNVVELPQYRAVRLHVDHARSELCVSVRRIELAMSEGRKIGVDHWLHDSARELAPLSGSDDERRLLLRDCLQHWVTPDPRGVYWAGADLGERNDPTEIIVSEDVGTTLRDVLRVQVSGMSYDAQAELIYVIHQMFNGRPFWGVDLGSAGTAVCKTLQNTDRFEDAGFDDALVGFHFQESVDCIGEDGEALEREDRDGERETVRAPAKHWATQCIVQRLQRGGYALAYDAEVLNDYTTQTAREGAKWPIYSKDRDHTVDARRQQMLRRLYAEYGAAVDVFAVGAHERAA